MAAPREWKQASAPLNPRGEERREEEEEEGDGCCCGCLGIFGSGGEKIRGGELSWLGEKWKAFLRKVGGYCRGNRRRRRRNGFQYDARSYALNFDDCGGREDDDFSVDFSDHKRGVGF